MLNFYDFECYAKDWLVVIINPVERKETVIVNDPRKLERYYKKHKHEIWIGYNSRKYDQFILKGILAGFDPKAINDFIIKEHKSGYWYSSLLNKIKLINYDVMTGVPTGLKTLEGFMGNDIRETDVPFDIDRKLTLDEINQTIKYCRHDVEQTIEVFLERQNDFDSHMNLIKTFKLPLEWLSKTQAQLSAEILNCQKEEREDEFEYSKVIVDTLRLKKYDHIRQWFINAPEDCNNEMLNGAYLNDELDDWDEDDINEYHEENEWKKHFYKRKIKVNVCGVPHVFGWGGLHGAPEKPIHRKGLLLHIDVTSFYPSIMIRYGLLTRNSRTPQKYKDIYDYRVKLKAMGKKAEQAPYKIVLNGTYGICKDKYSKAYDPRNANAVCVNGQLLLLDLLEHLEGHCELIQSNTDGLIIQIPDTNAAFEKIDDICYEWETRTGMSLGFDILDEIWQGDVNNYVFHFADIEENGKNRNKYERKGAYVKELSRLDNDLPIINKALVDYLTKGIPVETTINSCNDLMQFQKLVKLSNKYDWVEHNRRRYDYKCYRVFASKRRTDGIIYKCKTEGNKKDKFANTPDRCFIMNENINQRSIPDYLDVSWYINLAKKRLREKFGVDMR